MKFPKENIIDNWLNEFNRKRPIQGFWIRLKVSVKLWLIRWGVIK